jgi:hypothetical protein
MKTYNAYIAMNSDKEQVIVVRDLPDGNKSAILDGDTPEDAARKLVHETTGELLSEIDIVIATPFRH